MNTELYHTMSSNNQRFSSDVLSEAIRKYHREKVAKKIRKRNENGWYEVHMEMKWHFAAREVGNDKEYFPCYIKKGKYEKEWVAYLHIKLSKSENALDGWNWIKERFVRKLHERLFKSDNKYRDNATAAILSGYPFCPFEGRVALWISTNGWGGYYPDQMHGLCFSCCMNKVYHKAMTVKGTELWEEDSFTSPFRIIITKKIKNEFHEDDGHCQKVPKKRMEFHSLKNSKREKRFIPQIINGRVM